MPLMDFRLHGRLLSALSAAIPAMLSPPNTFLPLPSPHIFLSQDRLQSVPSRLPRFFFLVPIRASNRIQWATQAIMYTRLCHGWR
ncbi:hypothetical protein F4678DRAFT_225758 [Xylaria arbuscula]|nr:hypothetical protein F4678DRAFT_225758 [Xylaria arbuscula]